MNVRIAEAVHGHRGAAIRRAPLSRTAFANRVGQGDQVVLIRGGGLTKEGTGMAR